MDKNTFLVATIALLVGFIAGFLLANGINRSEMNSMRLQPAPSAQANTAASSPDEPSLSPEEIKAKVDEADKNPTNFQFQKDLGIGLYRYGAMKNDVTILNDAARILARANALDGKDGDVLTNLGNAYFDIGFARKDMASFEKAREIYNKALAVKPDDADVRTDLGISYYVQPQPDYPKAAAELKKVIDANPGRDRPIHFLAQVYIEQNKFSDAEKLLSRLKEINPKNPDLKDLAEKLEQAKSRTQ